jgi:hypothetical protein
MHPDYLFISFGIAALCAAAGFAFLAFRPAARRHGIPSLLWFFLGAGLLIQGFAPHLAVKEKQFVVPTSAVIDTGRTPKELIDRERYMQVLSAIFTCGATLGLAYCYRDLLFKSGSSRPASSKSGA